MAYRILIYLTVTRVIIKLQELHEMEVGPPFAFDKMYVRECIQKFPD